MKIYHQARAFWMHDRDPSRPHALIDGWHSEGYFNSDPVAEIPFILDQAIQDLVEKMREVGVPLGDIDRVICPFESADTIGHDLARVIVEKSGFGPRNVQCKPLCKYAYATKEPDNTRIFPRSAIKPGERILIAEDVLLTAGNAHATANAAEKAGAQVLPYYVALVNRTGREEIHGRRIVALINKHLPMWRAHECPLCAKGSEAIDPKPRENWDRLNAGYTDIARLNLA